MSARLQDDVQTPSLPRDSWQRPRPPSAAPTERRGRRSPGIFRVGLTSLTALVTLLFYLMFLWCLQLDQLFPVVPLPRPKQPCSPAPRHQLVLLPERVSSTELFPTSHPEESLALGCTSQKSRDRRKLSTTNRTRKQCKSYRSRRPRTAHPSPAWPPASRALGLSSARQARRAQGPDSEGAAWPRTEDQAGVCTVPSRTVRLSANDTSIPAAQC